MRTTSRPLVFKIADQPWEFEAIHRLNYRTFVEEIPQHAPNPEGRLVDRFHAENTYIICLHEDRLVGMLALRGKRPFSLDAKLPNLDEHLPAGHVPIEVRLLAVDPEFRQSIVFTTLIEHVVRYFLAHGFDLAVISGTTRQLKLYQHLGFKPFGPLVGTEQARYQPMMLTLDAFTQKLKHSLAFSGAFPGEAAGPTVLNLLPGPVTPIPEVQAAFHVPPVSHRGSDFLEQMTGLRKALCRLTGARQVQVLVGSGTLANEVVAAQLSLRPTTGLILSNGEFGERLAAIARRAHLRFDWLRLPWGEPFDLAQVNQFASRLPRGSWLWFVHHETSTGVLNPLAELKTLSAELGLQLCADCISSLGAVPVDLEGVHLATSASGKGLASYPGLALVFHDYVPQPAEEHLPAYLDLGHWASHQSVPHTHSSNLVGALVEAIRHITPARLRTLRENSVWLRTILREHGLKLIAPEAVACPAVITIDLAGRRPAAELAEELEQHGIWLSHRSRYLQERGWVQIALFGNPTRESLDRLWQALESTTGLAVTPPGAARNLDVGAIGPVIPTPRPPS